MYVIQSALLTYFLTSLQYHYINEVLAKQLFIYWQLFFFIYLLQYNYKTNYILIIYELNNFDHMLGVVSAARVSSGNRSHDPHSNSLAHYPLGYQATQLFS